MPTYGLIFCGYNTIDTIKESIEPWINIRENHGNDRLLICGVNVLFEGFSKSIDDGTAKYFTELLAEGKIDELINSPDNIPETVARGMAKSWLKERGVETVIQFDSDEIVTEEEIKRIFNYVYNNPFIPWFRLSYRNYVFDKKHYLAEAFTPPRIHRIEYNGAVGNIMLNLKANTFYDDNNIVYFSTLGQRFYDKHLPSMTIPESVANPKHYSWLSNERSKQKIIYQNKRWGHCSYKWTEHGLDFDQKFFKKNNINIPIIKSE